MGLRDYSNNENQKQKGKVMATYVEQPTKKVVSTNEEDMLNDAKNYAKTEFTSIKTLLTSMKIKFDEAELAKAWIKVKYDQIVEVRTKRVTYFD